MARRLLRGQSITEWLAELAKFGTVGAIALVVDVGLFNLLRFGPEGLLEAHPLTAKVISTSMAIIVAWLGNRLWAFRASRRQRHWREGALFLAVNIGGMGIAVACLWVSHYLMQLTSPLADNISANVIGLALGTMFRYVCYRYLVFTAGPDDEQTSEELHRPAELAPQRTSA